MNDQAAIRDAFETAMEMARDVGRDRIGIVGYGVIELFAPDGGLLLARPFVNQITDVGDLYYAQQAVAGIPPVNGTGAATKVTGMQIGSGSTAVAKSGAGGGMVTFLAGQACDATYPQTNNLGAGLGVEAVYKTTYAAGVGTGTVAEATITNGAIGSTQGASTTLARILTGTITKAAGDSLAITWRHKFLG
jgi:hypothetical protein